MQTIIVRVCGDQWLNPDEVQQTISAIPREETVEIDMRSEGASLHALGIVDLLIQHCDQTQRDPKKILITKWPNLVEPVPFTLESRKKHVSHFFWYSDRYRPEATIPSNHDYKFGFFIGRRTVSRGVMLWQHWKKYQHQTLFSLMRTFYPMPYPNLSPGIALDHIEDWLDNNELQEFVDWWSAVDIPSLDSHSIRDQYDPESNTNLDLLAHYGRFDVEIVCETFTRGQSFFVTEKTIRPLCSGKPMLIHAPKYFLKRLRDMGFKTWHSIWDETYDSLEGPERWHAMQSVIDHVSQIDSQQLKILCDPIGYHNHARVAELSAKHKPL